MRPLPAWTDTSLSGRPQSRRSAPRLEVEAILNGRLAKGNLRMTVHDLGFGGFAVESPIAFAVGSRHDFRFVGPEGMVVGIRAETVYARAVGLRDGMDHVLTGFKYVLETEDAERAVEALLDLAMSPISFD
ncbi:MAG: PilZ domain-containing protein [Acidobacteriota bacterium]